MAKYFNNKISSSVFGKGGMTIIAIYFLDIIFILEHLTRFCNDCLNCSLVRTMIEILYLKKAFLPGFVCLPKKQPTELPPLYFFTLIFSPRLSVRNRAFLMQMYCAGHYALIPERLESRVQSAPLCC